MTKKTLRNIALATLGVLALIQFIPVDRTNPPVQAGQDFIELASPPAELASLLKSACYDCHSHETQHPWYARVAPVSWLIRQHVKEGREHLNFSAWGAYRPEKQAHKAEECAEQVSNQSMPLRPYLAAHAEARLDAAQRERMATWFMALAQGPASQAAPQLNDEDQ